ncbi:MAG: carboxypeptidase-like regulatory domain-containing protein, partial [Candidatus Sulfotelmatobacter sp.]
MKLFWLLAAVLCGNVCRAQTSPSSDKPFQSSQHNPPARATSEPRATVARLTVTVTDENGVAVPLARIELQPPPPVLALRCETDFAGHCEFSNISSGAYAIEVEKIGFYAISQSDVQVGGTSNVDVTLTHQQEAREVVNVAESAPAIDPEQISSKEELTAAEIIDVPYPGAHDYRNGLIFIPGVTPDAYGLPHIAGAESYQTLLLLDGFNVTQPTNGQLVVRTSVESFRSIEVAASREPAEFGKGSGGVLALNTRMGDDHFHITS